MELLRLGITPIPTFLDTDQPHQDSLSYFSSITLPELLEIMSIKIVSSSPLDIIPTKFLFEIMDSIGPHLLSILNSLLSTGCVSDYFKTACY